MSYAAESSERENIRSAATLAETTNRWPTQIVAGDVAVGATALDVGSLKLREGCHLAGAVTGAGDLEGRDMGVGELRLAGDGTCVPFTVARTRLDAVGRFGLLVLPGL
jgi:hypothetical protein